MRLFATFARTAFPSAFRSFALATVLATQAGLCASAQTNGELQQLVAAQVEPWLDVGAGAAVVIRDQGRTTFINLGYADRKSGRRVSPDAIFNLSLIHI